MVKVILGIVAGVLLYHYYPDQVRDGAEKTAEIVHKGASVIADQTKPKSTIDTLTEKLK